MTEDLNQKDFVVGIVAVSSRIVHKVAVYVINFLPFVSCSQICKIHIFIGPLVYLDTYESTEREKIATVIGIASWSMGCGDTEYPDVYARVADVLDWITKETGLHISFLKQLLTRVI